MKRVFVLLLALVCIGILSAGALTPAESVTSDVDKVKFTHKEWTGTDYTNVDGNYVTGEDVLASIFGINREDATVPRIDYQSVSAAAEAGIVTPKPRCACLDPSLRDGEGFIISPSLYAKRKTPRCGVFFLVEARGIEPLSENLLI